MEKRRSDVGTNPGFYVNADGELVPVPVAVPIPVAVPEEEFSNSCQHAPYPEGRSCAGGNGGAGGDVGSMSDNDLKYEKKHIQHSANLKSDTASRKRLSEISAEQNKRIEGEPERLRRLHEVTGEPKPIESDPTKIYNPRRNKYGDLPARKKSSRGGNHTSNDR